MLYQALIVNALRTSEVAWRSERHSDPQRAYVRGEKMRRAFGLSGHEVRVRKAS